MDVGYDFESQETGNGVRKSAPKVLNIGVFSLYKIPLAIIPEMSSRVVLERFTPGCKHLSTLVILS